MSGDDHRHGSIAGYTAGCRGDCCRSAKLRYEKRRRWLTDRGEQFLVDPTGTRRRLQALAAIGWRLDDLNAHLGRKRAVHAILASERVTVRTAQRVAELYDELCMTPGPSVVCRQRAAKKGWAAPLMWDDIDNDPEPYQPPAVVKHRRKQVDEVVVLRALRGLKVDGATPAERREVVRRWLRMDRTLAELERIQGWRADNYKEAG